MDIKKNGSPSDQFSATLIDISPFSAESSSKGTFFTRNNQSSSLKKAICTTRLPKLPENKPKTVPKSNNPFTFSPLVDHFVSSPQILPSLYPRSSNHHYTLVLDLDETLLHTRWIKGSQERYIVHERPFVREFLRSVKELHCFEIVIFTAGVQDYADTVIDILDEETNAIHHRLYRQHTTTWGWFRLKDLSLLNRDLSTTLLVDNSPEVFANHPTNGVPISAWEGSESSKKVGDIITPDVTEDFAMINLFIWLEYLSKLRLPIPLFVEKYQDELKKAIGYSCHYKAPKDYSPPFEIGPLSKQLLKRCFPDRGRQENKSFCATASF